MLHSLVSVSAWAQTSSIGRALVFRRGLLALVLLNSDSDESQIKWIFAVKPTCKCLYVQLTLVTLRLDLDLDFFYLLRRQLERDNTWIWLYMSLTSPQQVLYLVVGRECMAATKVEVCGWKAGTASSVYMPPVCRWFKLTMSVITTSPVSWVKHTEKIKTNTCIKDYCLLSFFIPVQSLWAPWLRVCSHCEGKACVLGDIPVPRKHRGPPASLWRQPRPPEVPVILGNAESVRYVKICQLFKHLRRGNTLM